MRDVHTFFISADLAQTNDYTAITIIERIALFKENCGDAFGRMDNRYSRCEKAFHVRHIERPERGTTYPKIVERIRELYESRQLLDQDKAVVIDITGVGRPVWDMMQNTGFRNKMNGILITGGSETTRDNAIFHVPKRDLISCLQVAFQNGTFKIAKALPESEALVRELTNFKVKINANGHDQYEAWREGIHDDLVLSAAMGVWLASRDHCRISRTLRNIPFC